MIIFLLMLLLGFMPEYSFSGNCDYPWQRDFVGRRCGGRAAACSRGGRLGDRLPANGCAEIKKLLKIEREYNSLNNDFQDMQRDLRAEVDSLQRELAIDDSLKRELLADNFRPQKGVAGGNCQPQKTAEKNKRDGSHFRA